MVQKLPSGEFSVSLSITESGTGESRASFMKNGTAAAVQDGTLINDASESLLSQMGVTLTETGRRTLTTGRYMAARAEAGYARGVAAEAGGAAVEALLNYSQAVAFDPSQLESLSRLGSVSSEISGGSVSANILNDLQARDAWLAAFKEAAAFFNSHPPFEIAYDPNLLQIGDTDYVNRRADLAMRISVAPSEAGFAALNALLEGLEKTGKRKTWGFAGWPLLDITPRKAPEAVLFPGKRSFSFMVDAGLVNENGKVIARGKTTLKTGALSFKAGDAVVSPPEGAFGQIEFPKVNAADLTPTLTVVIAGVNGMSGRRISETGYMRIAPGNLARMEEEWQRQLAAKKQQQEPPRRGSRTEGYDPDGKAVVAILPFTGEKEAAIVFDRAVADAVAGLQKYSGQSVRASAVEAAGVRIPTDMPPIRELTPGARYALTGGVYPGGRGDGYYLQLWLWDMANSTMIYTDDLVYQDIDEGLMSVPGLVGWLFSHITE
jgi:hypothetical protein